VAREWKLSVNPLKNDEHACRVRFEPLASAGLSASGGVTVVVSMSRQRDVVQRLPSLSGMKRALLNLEVMSLGS
jgi:hypothetical protein